MQFPYDPAEVVWLYTWKLESADVISQTIPERGELKLRHRETKILYLVQARYGVFSRARRGEKKLHTRPTAQQRDRHELVTNSHEPLDDNPRGFALAL